MRFGASLLQELRRLPNLHDSLALQLQCLPEFLDLEPAGHGYQPISHELALSLAPSWTKLQMPNFAYPSEVSTSIARFHDTGYYQQRRSLLG